MSDRLKTTFCGIEFKNPVITASGTFGYGLEYAKYIDISKLGGISVKGISLKEVQGNPMPRIMETTSGMLNAIGLQNVGVERFITEKLPELRKHDTKIIVNFWGKTIEEYVEVARILDEADVDMLEMNISCPNIKEGGIAFGTDPKMTHEVTYNVKKVLKNKPLMVKLSPNVTNIKVYAQACEQAGADAISAINTLLGMSVNIHNRKPNIYNITGGLSGPAIKPVAIRMVHETFRTVKIPIMGIGGIIDWKDVVEFGLVGASAVQVGTANFIDPEIPLKIISDLDKYMAENNIGNFSELTGTVNLDR
ncbi:dihydroorotate dehydrogenase [Seleniivibrio woodruffii]|uniref:Dihydroorotate dehydrogenase n=1 Tax=Seleniivibrio woodruffii TaxID=1078050 RepID=A0A4V2PRZ4_9BACT|nr:dihydroorotate dehydrogenase [Seleniivibrio woodruffii]TCK60741.1 dihydroorotate oxidase B catalytic subunit [Seleniivibrio woodruffii]TVZ36371.1 dihydroorotate oxidase B, catalytic subunit [Seleniivibrio woodruffii]